jgi:tetratricopeptide (TPR) repeat protein
MLFPRSRTLNIALSLLVLSSMMLSGLAVEARATDLVPESDLAGGASVFVFRKSRKVPQERGAARSFMAGGAAATGRRQKIRSQIVSARQKRAAAAKARAAALARARARERNAKLKLSNTLAAKGESQMEAGDIAGAMLNFRESLKANPNNAEAKEGLSEALTATAIQEAGESLNESAVPLLDEAVKLDPKNAVAYAKLGEIHDAKGRNDQALINFEKALAIEPEFTSLYLPVGIAYVEAGKIPEGENYLNKATAAGLDSSEAKFARITILTKQGKDAEALAMYDEILKTEPNNAQAHYQKGVLHAKLNQEDLAVASYKAATAADANLAAAWFDLGVIFYNKGDYNNALSAYQTVVKIEPENYKAQANLASTYRQLERFAEANAAYKAAEPGNKGNADLYSEWGYCLGKTNEWDKAVSRTNTARELSPTAVDNNNTGWAYYNAARWDKSQQKDKEATAKLELGKQYLEKSVEQDPQLDAAYLNLGATKNSLGDHDGAVQSLNKALTLHSDWVIALNQLGLAFRGKNDLASAVDTFRRVSTLDANNAFGLVNLGEVYFLTGNKKEAKKVHDQLKKVNPQLAGRLNDVMSGKIVVDKVNREIQKKVPRIPGVKIPF